MADTLNENGLSIDSYNTLLENIQNAMNTIYASDGDSINFDSETPDGQFTNILAQMGSDNRQLALNIYNSFDPNAVGGVVQDSRYALNFLIRKGGTFTVQNIDVTVNQTVTLQGLDGNYNDINAASYTVSDDAGNLWYLIDTTTLTENTTTSLPFRSQNMGLVQPTIGTITTQVTKVLGVTGVNNSVAPTSLGEEQESDAEFRIRRNRSVAVKGQNNYDAVTGQLLALDGVTDAKVFINNTLIPNTTVTDKEGGIPAYTVWIIVDGGANSDIAEVIYQNSAGLPTIGDVTVDVPTVSGQIFTVSFDRDNPVPLHIRFDIKNTDPNTNYSEENIKQYIADNLIFNLSQPAETSYITEVAAQALLSSGTGLYALNVEVSTDGTNWSDFIASTSWQNKFVVDTSRITLNQV